MLVRVAKVALVDFDGTLFSTKDALYSSYSSVFMSLNKNLDKADFLKYIYYSNSESSILHLLDGDESLVNAVRELKISRYPEFFDQIKLNSQLISVLKEFERSIIFSNASRNSIDLVLREFNLTTTFTEILTPDIFNCRKPEIQAFKYVFSHLNLDPDQLVLYDDDPQNINVMRKLGGIGELVILK